MSNQKSPSAVVRTLVLTDLVSSTHLVEKLGDELSHEVGARHDRLARDLLVKFNGQEIDKTDGFLMLFERPLDAVEFSLRYHQELDRLSREMDVDLQARAGVHLGEVFLRENPPEHVARGAKPLEVEGLAKPTAARVMSLAQGRQTLLTAAAFDLAKRAAVGREIADGAKVEWVSHGPYRFKGVEQPLEVFEAGVAGQAPLTPPPATEKARPVADAAQPFAEGSEVNGRYQILRFRGDSPEGRIYRAYDRRRQQDVTLVEIGPELAADPSRRSRWERMASASATLDHPNILSLHELDDSGDRTLLVRQYVEGRTLAEPVQTEPPSNVELARLLRQVCEALSAAHAKGLIHGNLSADSIVVDRDGFAFVEGVGGFHSGEAVSPETLDPDTISPETVRGQPLDQRSDIFALGCVFHALATGSPAYPGATPHAKMIQRLEKASPSPRRHRPDLDPLLDRVLQRCLAPADRRFGDLAEIEKELGPLLEPAPERHSTSGRRPLALGVLAALLVVAVAAGWLFFSRSGPLDGGPAEVPVVAVIPFENRTGDNQLDWLGEGLARLISDRLGESKHLRVVSRGRVDALLKEAEGDSQKLSATAAAGSIGFLLNGEILPDASGFTVATRLIDSRRQEQVESRRVADLAADGLLEAAEPISLAVRRGLNVPLADEIDVFAADFVTRNPEAYEAFVEGMRAWTEFDYDKAEDYFDTALKRAPDYKMARFRRASVLAETGRISEALADIRATLANTDDMTKLQIDYVKAAEAWWSRRYDEAIELYRGLLKEYPYETEARYSLAIILTYDTRRYQEAIQELRQLAQIEPEVHSTWSMLGTAQLQMRDFEGAVQSLQRYVELEHGSPNSHELLGDSYRAQGDFGQAAIEYKKAIDMDATFASAAIKLAVAEALMGKEEAAERRLRPLTSDRRLPPRQRIDSAFELVAIMSSQGRFREAAFFLEALQQPLQEENVRVAMGLSTRGRALLELGDVKEASRLIDEAIEKSPGVPTRYLFARAILELKRGSHDSVDKTAAQILAGALPPDNPDRTEEKAAHYLTGMAALAQGRIDDALAELRQSVALDGYRYAIYRAGLAEALFKAGDYDNALEQALHATKPLDPVEPRLDLELDRRKALLTLAKIQGAMGRKGEAKATIDRFQDLWTKADPDVAAWAEEVESGS